MPRKRKFTDDVISHAHSLNVGGMQLCDIAKELKVHPDNLSQELRRAGFEIIYQPFTPHNKLQLPVDKVCAMYEEGNSENRVALHFKVARNVIRRILTEQGVAVRTQSEAESLKWSKMPQEQRQKQVEAAHVATKGCVKSIAELTERAIARQKILHKHYIGHGEPEFFEFLKSQGIPFTYQKAIGVYNVDFAIGNIAVELSKCTTRFHARNAKMRKRSEYLLNAGYKTLAVDFNEVPALIANFDNIISVINEMNRLEAFGREYWVVCCRFNRGAIGHSEKGKFSFISSPIKPYYRRRVVNL